ncbi:hypothetical protein [Aquitalea sp. LB_tupeE]|uniref:hypothetical protein n=1 Tax=Aquitalea sp. LB_tupeE TaxID=2748078 RepID=UPI0015BA8191|nr:hypothetical protein [Aquitalea sp. LB_tupeE]NWK79237.1 hypothetical protein [Aquitalea sp. LB_tupeE]
MMPETATLRLHAAALRSTRWLLWPGPCLLLLASLHAGEWQLQTASALAMLLQSWFCWRLQLDAALLAALENSPSLTVLDDTIKGLFGKAAARRDFAQRQQGMRRLLIRFFMTTALCWILAICAIMLSMA